MHAIVATVLAGEPSSARSANAHARYGHLRVHEIPARLMAHHKKTE
jgi:hypothetical protein